MNELAKRVVKQRLKAAGLSWSCTWDGDGVVAPKAENVDQSTYDAGKAIVEATTAEGERRFKTKLEFWDAFAAYPQIAQGSALKWAAVVGLRKLAMEEPDTFAEVFQQAALEVELLDPATFAVMEAAGLLEFDALEIETDG